MSTFEADYEENANLDNVTLGLCGYGSGAKAKVFSSNSLIIGREHVLPASNKNEGLCLFITKEYAKSMFFIDFSTTLFNAANDGTNPGIWRFE